MSKTKILIVAAIVASSAATAWGDGMIVPTREDLRVRGMWAVKYHHVKMIVRGSIRLAAVMTMFTAAVVLSHK